MGKTFKRGDIVKSRKGNIVTVLVTGEGDNSDYPAFAGVIIDGLREGRIYD